MLTTVMHHFTLLSKGKLLGAFVGNALLIENLIFVRFCTG